MADSGDKIAYAINEVTRIAPIGRTALYEAIRRGLLPARKLGRRTIILEEDLRAFLAGLPPLRPPDRNSG